MQYVLIAMVCAFIGLGTAAYYARWVLKQDPGDEKMRRISKHIQEGALAFLSREYRVVAIVLVVVAIAMAFFLQASGGAVMAIAYLVGAIFSGTAGFIGLSIATRANSRTTQAATKSMPKALEVAFRGGAVMGLTVAGLGLLGVCLCFLIFLYATGLVANLEIVKGASWTIFGLSISSTLVFSDIIPAFGLGASTIALFARVGGGIYTKAADVGADLVGKVEAGIPEDDPRNPAVIADNVGDNVGDVAGMGADLYESYVGAIVAPLALGALYLGFRGALLPVLIAAVGMVCSAIATLFVRGREGGHPGRALSHGHVRSGRPDARRVLLPRHVARSGGHGVRRADGGEPARLLHRHLRRPRGGHGYRAGLGDLHVGRLQRGQEDRAVVRRPALRPSSCPVSPRACSPPPSRSSSWSSPWASASRPASGHCRTAAASSPSACRPSACSRPPASWSR